MLLVLAALARTTGSLQPSRMLASERDVLACCSRRQMLNGLSCCLDAGRDARRRQFAQVASGALNSTRLAIVY